MKKRIVYIAAIFLLAAANGLQGKANDNFFQAKRRAKELRQTLPRSDAQWDEIVRDESFTAYINSGRAWARPGFVCAGLGTIAMIAAMIRREKGWHSMTILLWIFYGMQITAS